MNASFARRAISLATIVASAASCREPSRDLPELDPSSRTAARSCAASPAATAMTAIAASSFCPTSGRIEALGAGSMKVAVGGMRGTVAGGASRSAELAFVYRGTSRTLAPLANGELRRQIGLKLRAENTCNTIYVMWHVEPTPGIAVSVKRNAGMATHAQCADRGYIHPPGTPGRAGAPVIVAGEAHTLRADLDGDELRVEADGAIVWQGTLPQEALAFDGPVGVRSDNGEFDFEVRVPGGDRLPSCPEGAPRD